MRKRLPKQFGDYQVVRALRSGGEATVCVGRHKPTGDTVAIRVLLMHGNTEAVRRHFVEEVSNLRELRHPHIIPLKDYGITEEYAYLVMPLVPDGSIGDLVRKGRQFVFDDVLEMLQQAAQALSYAHNNHITHRDVKPDNLLRGSNGILLSDFGISRRKDATQTMARGTPHYCPPEQWRGDPEPASDQYALAVTACWLLTGQFPGDGGREQLIAKYPDIALVLDRALQIVPGDRYPSMVQFSTALEHATITGRPRIPDLVPPKAHVDPRPSRPRPLPLIAAIGAIVLLVALSLGGWLVWEVTHQPSPLSSTMTFCLGTDFPTTHADASKGTFLANGADLAIISNSNLGPGYKLDHCDKNDVSLQTLIHDPDTGKHNVQQLIADKTVLGLVGPGNSNVAEAEIPVAANAGLPVVSPYTSVLCLTQQYCGQDQLRPDGVSSTFFRICSTDEQQAKAAALLFEQLGLHTVSVVDDSESYGQELANFFMQDVKRDGVNVLAGGSISNGEQIAQIAGLAQTISSLKPDAIFYAGVTSTGGGLLKGQLAQAGFTGPLIGGTGIADDQQFLDDANKDANNTYAIAVWPDPSTLDPSFIKNYENHYTAAPNQLSALSYDAAMILITAIRSLIQDKPQIMHSDVGTIRGAVLDKVQHPDQSTYSGLTGPITFDSNGDNTAQQKFITYTVENGQWIVKKDYTFAID